MTRQEFIERFRHVIGGMILDAATSGRSGEALSIRLRTTMDQIDRLLGQAFDSLQPKPAAVNGTDAKKPTSQMRG